MCDSLCVVPGGCDGRAEEKDAWRCQVRTVVLSLSLSVCAVVCVRVRACVRACVRVCAGNMTFTSARTRRTMYIFGTASSGAGGGGKSRMPRTANAKDRAKDHELTDEQDAHVKGRPM